MTASRWDMLIFMALVLGALAIAAGRVGGPAVAVAPSLAPAARSEEPAPQAGHPAPDFRLADLGGAPVALGELRGQVVLVNIWATWCPPCRAEMPAIQASYERHRAAGFTVLAVNQREGLAEVRAFMDERGLSFPALLDADGQVGAAYQASALPSSFLIDRAGVVRVVYRGPLPRGVLDAAVASLLAEP